CHLPPRLFAARPPPKRRSVERFAGSDEVPGTGSEEVWKLNMKNGRLWLTVLSIVVAFYAFMTIFAIIAPPAVIHSITKYDWQTCFKMYVNEYSRIQQLETNQVEWTFVASGVISSLTLVSAIGL